MGGGFGGVDGRQNGGNNLGARIRSLEVVAGKGKSGGKKRAFGVAEEGKRTQRDEIGVKGRNHKKNGGGLMAHRRDKPGGLLFCLVRLEENGSLRL